MRRRTIIKELTDGFIEDEQRRTGLGSAEYAARHSQRKAELFQGVQKHRRRHPREQWAGDAGRNGEGDEEQVVVIQHERKGEIPERNVVKGACRHCGKHIGKGIHWHEKYCT